MTTSCGKLLCAPVVVGKRFSFAGRYLCALQKARRAPLHPIGEYALLSPHAPTADCRERTALSKHLREVGSFPHKTPLFGFEGSVFFASSSRAYPSGGFRFFPFTSSPTYCNAMIVNVFGVKVFAFLLHIMHHSLGLHRSARKVCFSAKLGSKAREYRTETADGEGKNQKPSPQTNSTSTDCAQWVKE